MHVPTSSEAWENGGNREFREDGRRERFDSSGMPTVAAKARKKSTAKRKKKPAARLKSRPYEPP